MPQLVLPLFSPDCKLINNQVGFEKIGSRIYYFHGRLPVFSHEEDDLESFRFITSQLVVGGNVKQQQIVKAFGVSAISVKRSVKRLREHGPKGFFRQSARTRSAHVLTPEVKEKVRKCLDRGLSVSETGKKLNINSSTIHKAIQSGQLEKKKRQKALRSKETKVSAP